MDTLDIGQIVSGLPSFLGLIFCVYVLEKENRSLRDELRRIIDVIIKRENCPEE